MTCSWLQVDFPTPALDVLYVGPQPATCPDPQSLEALDPDLKRRTEKLCGRASTFGYVITHPCVTRATK